VSLTAGRSLAPLLVVVAVACSGTSTPPPPDSSPTPAASEGALRPLSSRESGPATTAPEGGGPGQAATLPPGHPPLEGLGTPGPVAPSGDAVSGTIELASELGTRVGPSDVLYVMAKKDGATLAVQRIESPSFPLPFQVSEGHAMVAGTPLEGPVDVVARLSRTGDAIPSPGDLEGSAVGVAVPSEGVTVTIDHVRQ
jgi:cytochrome c-type biogenesis protein CcmH